MKFWRAVREQLGRRYVYHGLIRGGFRMTAPCDRNGWLCHRPDELLAVRTTTAFDARHPFFHEPRGMAFLGTDTTMTVADGCVFNAGTQPIP